MNVASLVLSRELYEVSGWESDYGIVLVNKGLSSEYQRTQEIEADEDLDDIAAEVFAYDLGYLLRKLPNSIEEFYDLVLMPTDRQVQIGYVEDSAYDSLYWKIFSVADELEDAAVKLAIELFRQGALTRGGDE